MRRFDGENVCPPSRVFHVGVRVSLDDLHPRKSSPGEFIGDEFRTEEREVERRGAVEELLDATAS